MKNIGEESINDILLGRWGKRKDFLLSLGRLDINNLVASIEIHRRKFLMSAVGDNSIGLERNLFIVEELFQKLKDTEKICAFFFYV